MAQSPSEIREREITDAEAARLTNFGQETKSWAVILGIFAVLAGIYVLVNPPVADVPAWAIGTETEITLREAAASQAVFFNGMALALGVAGIIASLAFRKARAPALEALGTGTVYEATATVRGAGQAGVLELGGATLAPAGTRRDPALLKAMNTAGGKVKVTYTRPTGPAGNGKALLLAVDETALTKPAACGWVGKA